MVTVTAGSAGLIRMDLINFGSFSGGSVVSESGTSMVIDVGSGFRESLFGAGLSYDGAGQLTGGTITGLQETYNGGVTYTISGASLPVGAFTGYVANHDTNGALSTIFGGDDQITGGAVGDFIRGFGGNDVLQGGSGSDTIIGGSGNSHIYGGLISGGIDGNDSITGGSGNDYIQGNAGNDTITGGDGNDRINGGADNDSLSGGNGDDAINGNRGNDTIDGNDGNDVLRGGQGDDLIYGGNGNDVLMGDLGNDTLIGNGGIDQMTGGDGSDLFKFSPGDAGFATSGDLAWFPDGITDFTIGQDKISLGFHVGAVLTASADDMQGALTAAQNQMFAHPAGYEVVAVQVGSSTYLFWHGDGTNLQIDSAVNLQRVTATSLSTADFV